MNHARRLSLLRRRLRSAGHGALLVTHLPDIRYLTGFTGSSAALVVAGRVARLFTDGRYRAQAAAEVTDRGIHVEIVAQSLSVAAVTWAAAQPAAAHPATAHPAAASPGPAAATLAFNPGHTTVADLERWRKALPAAWRRRFLVPLDVPLVEPLRMIKDEDEIATLTRAAALGCQLFDHMLGFLRPGLTEVDVAAELEHEARLNGAESMSFETIVASGARSALPHGRASVARLPRRGLLTLDFGVVVDGYCSDMTRTVCLGKPTARELAAYEAVLAALQAAVAAVAHGASCGDVDEAARSILRQAGMDEAFSHSTGHGVGLEIHEPPRLGAGQSTRLAAGMVVTIEPGVYFPGHFGVRIEDMVAVTRTGGTVLTSSPKALIQL